MKKSKSCFLIAVAIAENVVWKLQVKGVMTGNFI